MSIVKNVILLGALLLDFNLKKQEWILVGGVNNPGNNPSISVSSSNPNSVWISGGNGDTAKIFRSTNGAYNWHQLQLGLPSKELYCIWSFNENICFTGEGVISGNAKLFRTTNGGTIWEIILQTPPNRGFFNGLGFTKHNSNIFGLAIAERLYRTSDGGNSWVEINLGVNGVSNAQN